MENLFKSFTQYALDNGIVIVDTKFEIFINSKGEWVLGDEVLTPESSRFISKEDFDAGNYISMDKQILRDFGKAQNWKEQAKSLKAGEKLEVNVPQEIKDKILSGYTTILNRLSK
jgi:phosphoribosylaminoimidazole-succinocarboxamide synthase